MKCKRRQTFRTLGIASALIFSVCATAEDDTPKPTSAADIGGNVKSFFGNLGKGVTIRKPYEEYDVVSRGVVPGRGPGYCLRGEPMPHLYSAPNQVSLALIPCRTLEDTGQFQLMAKATAAASPSGVAGGANAEVEADPSKQCTHYHVSVDNGTGDQYCVERDGAVVGITHYTKKADGSGYDMAYEPFEHSVSIGVLKAGGSVGSDGKIVLPADVQGGWDKLDRMKEEGAARIKAEGEANQAANADRSMVRKAAMAKCKPLINGGDAQMTAFKACYNEATK